MGAASEQKETAEGWMEGKAFIQLLEHVLWI